MSSTQRPAPCRTRLLEMLPWISAVGSGHPLSFLVLVWSISGLCQQRDRLFPGLCCFVPLQEPKASLREGYGWVQTENRGISSLRPPGDSNHS